MLCFDHTIEQFSNLSTDVRTEILEKKIIEIRLDRHFIKIKIKCCITRHIIKFKKLLIFDILFS